MRVYRELSWRAVAARARAASRTLSCVTVGLVTLAICSMADASTVAIDWVTVGDPGNIADTTGYGAVDREYRMGRYEFTNSQYAVFLNAVDPDATSALYRDGMNPALRSRGGIIRTLGSAAGSRYTTSSSMAEMPVNYVSIFEAAMVCNWLEKGGLSYATSAAGWTAIQDGSYTLPSYGSSGFPNSNPGATYTIPTQDEWYKAAYYKGGATTAGYWLYPTASDSVPTPGEATAVGIGTNGITSPIVNGNFANYGSQADWDGYDGNVTAVGTNGGPSPYGTFDQGGNVFEWMTKGSDITQVVRGGCYDFPTEALSSSYLIGNAMTRDFGAQIGFRLVASVPGPSAVPEIDPSGIGSVLALVTAALGLVERRRVKAG